MHRVRAALDSDRAIPITVLVVILAIAMGLL